MTLLDLSTLPDPALAALTRQAAASKQSLQDRAAALLIAATAEVSAGLTAKQAKLLRFIHAQLRETGVSPSYDEMRRALGLKSKTGIHRLVRALEERGCIQRMPGRPRSLQVLEGSR